MTAEDLEKVLAAVRACPPPPTPERVTAFGGFTDENTVRTALTILRVQGKITLDPIMAYLSSPLMKRRRR